MSVEIIHDYFRCFGERDRERLTEILEPDFVHVSPFKRYDDRDAMLDEIWPHVGGIGATDIRVYGDGPEFMVRYQHTGASDARLAEWFRFEGDRIAEVEVFLGLGAVPGPEGR